MSQPRLPSPVDFKRLRAQAPEPLQPWLDTLAAEWSTLDPALQHGDSARWQAALAELPTLNQAQRRLNTDAIKAWLSPALEPSAQQQLEQALKRLSPWRKGPYHLHGIFIDTEWRSDWKWQRLQADLPSLRGKRVLDVGCGNGYHMWRMLGEGAQFVLGLDPSVLFLMQFQAVKQLLWPEAPVHLLPLPGEQLPERTAAFDMVFSMGVIYHRRSPIEHIQQLRDALRPGGHLLIETIVVEGDENTALVPKDRYARMRNVWFLPSARALAHWMRRCGLSEVNILDESVTELGEQRRTDWMRFESLQASLNAEDPRFTVEGYPAPRRAIVCGTLR